MLNPNAFEASTSTSLRRQALVTVVSPGFTCAVFTRRVVGFPGFTTRTAVGIRPPPLDGMQPANGLKLGARAVAPT